MKTRQNDTPPSSINGDEITAMEEEADMFEIDEMDEVEEVELEDLEAALYDEDMEPPEDLSAVNFSKHEKSVFCCDLHPNGKLAVTGGEDDKAFVWLVETGEVVMECTGHKDSVIYVGFSHDGAFVATADMGGVVKVWKCNPDAQQQENWPIAFEDEAHDISWGMWHFGTRVLIIGVVTGDIFIFKIPSGETKVLQNHNIRVDCGKLFPDGTRLAAGYDDGSIKVWDLKSCTALQHIPPGIHQTAVTAIDTHIENNLMASISVDGTVAITTSANGKVVSQIEAEHDLETVAFSQDPQNDYFALGTLNGDISIWDTGKKMVRHKCKQVSGDTVIGVTKIVWDRNYLLTGCLDGSIRIYEGRTGDEALVLTGHTSEILDFCHNAKEKTILTTSDDGTARIFKYDL